MLQFVVDEEEQGLRPDHLLRRRHPNIDRALALKILKAGRFIVDGERARLATKLVRGQKVMVEMSPERAGPTIAAAAHGDVGVPVVFAAPGVLVIDKPAGLAMHTGTGVEDDAVTLHGILIANTEIEEGFAGPSFLGRLDRPTSGLVICATTRAGLVSVEPQWREGLLEKGYLALVVGKTPEQGLIDIPLAARRPRHKGTGRIEESVTVFRTLAGNRTASLVLVEPRTGRTHQIRRHMKAIGHPIVGDDRYGDVRRDRELVDKKGSLMLHAWRYRHEGLVKTLPKVMEAPCPARIKKAAQQADLDTDVAIAAGRAAPFGVVDDDGTSSSRGGDDDDDGA